MLIVNYLSTSVVLVTNQDLNIIKKKGDKLNLKGKVAIITGGNKGIGRAISIAFAKRGANIVIAARDIKTSQKVIREITKFGIRCLSIKVDVSKGQKVKQMVDLTLEKFGRIDILVNNAGVISASPIKELTEEEWDKVFEVNVKGTFLCCKYVTPVMIKQRKGKIINLSSTAGKRGSIFRTHYSASKFAVIGLTKSLAIELAPYGINVNAVCPGDVQTAMLDKEVQLLAKLRNTPPDKVKEKKISSIPLGRLGKPEEIAELVLFLASPASDYITGEAISIAGGAG